MGKIRQPRSVTTPFKVFTPLGVLNTCFLSSVYQEIGTCVHKSLQELLMKD